MDVYFRFLRPVLFKLNAEWMHDRAIQVGEIAGSTGTIRKIISSLYCFHDNRLETEVCGMRFPNPVGLAAGFDKNGRAVMGLSAMGFGHVEIGSVSFKSSRGNPKPRLFRLSKDEALVVHYGLPSDGAAAIAARMMNVRRQIPLGINIAKTNRGIAALPESDYRIIADYVCSVHILKNLGDYICLNLSCPNTRDGRDFFTNRQNTIRLLDALSDAEIQCPVFLKIPPLGGARRIEEWLEAVEGVSFISGFAFNVPPGKPDNLLTPRHIVDRMPGAVCGKPIEQYLNEYIRDMYLRMDRNRYTIIGSGGVSTAEGAYQKIRLGASLVQLLTGMVYHGPGLAKRINRGLSELLERDGFSNVSEAVGTGTEL